MIFLRFFILLFVVACGNDDPEVEIDPLFRDGVRLEYSVGDEHDFGNVSVGSTETIIITITNNGDTAAGSMGESDGAGKIEPPFDFAGGSYPGTNGTCTITLGSGQSCTVEFEFSPTSTGNFLNDPGITYYDSSDIDPVDLVITLDLKGTGI